MEVIMKKMLTKILLISLLFSAAVPSNVQASWFTDAKSTTASSKLVKIGAKYLWRSGIFATAAALGLTTGAAIHEWGHATVFNYFYPNSAKIEKIHPLDGRTRFNPPKKILNRILNHKNNCLKIVDRLKVATGCVAGPIVGFLGSYSLFRLLKHYNTKNLTHLSYFLIGLELGFFTDCLLNITNAISTDPSTDGARARSILIKNVWPKTGPSMVSPPHGLPNNFLFNTSFLPYSRLSQLFTEH